MKISHLVEQVSKVNEQGGYYEGAPNIKQLTWLVITELAEATEAHRENRKANVADFIKGAAIEDSGFVRSFKGNIKDSFEEEIADTLIRIIGLCACRNVQVMENHSRVHVESLEDSFLTISKLLIESIQAGNPIWFTLNKSISILHSIAVENGFDLVQMAAFKTRYNSLNLIKKEY